MVRICLLILLAVVCLPIFGCGKLQCAKPPVTGTEQFQAVATQIEYPDVKIQPQPEIAHTMAPRSVRVPDDPEYWDLPLYDAMQLALANSEVIRDLGGTIINAPQATPTVLDVAVQESSPLRGAEAALSAFDAQFSTNAFHGRSEQAFNNFFIGGGVNVLRSNSSGLNTEINKQAATGTSLTLRNITDYARNTSPANVFPSAYTTNFEAEVRQPLLQGAGIEFNRIAGPNATAGNYNGVLIARIDTDVSLADFEAAIRNLVRDVETAYWELFFAYRNFEARKKQRDSNLDTWRYIYKRFAVGREASQNESLAREAYYIALGQAQEALSGRSDNSTGGIYASERRLRYLLGLPASDHQLIRPADEPIQVDVRFDWTEALMQALVRRVELRRQKWQIKRREMELIAARNFRRMRLDFTGRYRFAGFGDNLFGNNHTAANSAFESLFTDGLEQWQIGLELQTPVGNRIGHTAIRNAELQLARENAIYQNLELKVSHDLSGAFVDIDQAYVVSRSRYNRAIASHENVDSLRKRYEEGVDPIQFYLDAVGRASEADSAYYRALVDYNLAIMNLQFERGTLLEYRNVHLAEGPWLPAAYESAAKQSHRFRPPLINYVKDVPGPVSLGPVPHPPVHHGPGSQGHFPPDGPGPEPIPAGDPLIESNPQTGQGAIPGDAHSTSMMEPTTAGVPAAPDIRTPPISTNPPVNVTTLQNGEFANSGQYIDWVQRLPVPDSSNPPEPSPNHLP